MLIVVMLKRRVGNYNGNAVRRVDQKDKRTDHTEIVCITDVALKKDSSKNAGPR